MGFMLNEVFAQAVSQINNWLYRSRKKDRTLPRYLRAVILTVPPSMPQVERGIFKQHAQRALSLLWKSMGWHVGEGDPVEDDEDEKRSFRPPLAQDRHQVGRGDLRTAGVSVHRGRDEFQRLCRRVLRRAGAPGKGGS